jgi:hypothetical protein
MSTDNFRKAIFSTMGYAPKISEILPGKIATVQSKDGNTEVFAMLLKSGNAGFFGSFGFLFEAGDVPRTPYQVNFWHATIPVEDLHKASQGDREEIERDILGTFRAILDDIESGRAETPFWLNFFATLAGGVKP